MLKIELLEHATDKLRLVKKNKGLETRIFLAGEWGVALVREVDCDGQSKDTTIYSFKKKKQSYEKVDCFYFVGCVDGGNLLSEVKIEDVIDSLIITLGPKRNIE